ncbi:hypothetical protein [Dactylosporangium sp. CA-092794]|uniref:hypothetical protein n=1 Tax=Dactylosporangium sp. CA-092794 TaxID=3239929 RepID=UPI003D8A6BA9
MFDLDEIAQALQDQDADYFDSRVVLDPATGRTVLWTSDGGIDGETPADPEDLGLIPIEPLPSWVWYRDMVDFAAALSDERAGRALERAIEGRGAFRRFGDVLHRDHPELVSVFLALRDARAARRAVQWLLDNKVIDGPAAERMLAEHPDPAIP